MTDVIDRLLESRLFCYCFCCWAMLCIIFIYGQLLPTRQMDYWFLEKTLNLSEVTFSESPNIFVFINFLIFSCTFSSYVVAQDASIIIKRVFDFSQKYAHYQCNQNKTQQNQKQWINDQDKKKQTFPQLVRFYRSVCCSLLSIVIENACKNHHRTQRNNKIRRWRNGRVKWKQQKQRKVYNSLMRIYRNRNATQKHTCTKTWHREMGKRANLTFRYIEMFRDLY